MTDIRERDLSRKADKDLTREEREELKRRFNEFAQMVRENGAARMGIQESKPKQDKRVKKWDPTSMAKQVGRKRS